jgi:translation elongation factor EF-Tu-like GTPase
MGWFGRKKDLETPEEMLARFHAESPAPSSAAQAPVAAATGGMLTVEDVFQITGRGTVATGRVQFARLSAGDRITIQHAAGGSEPATVKALETRGRRSTTAEPGTLVGVLFVERVSVAAGDAITF